MPYRRRTLPFFTVSDSSRRESFTLPDYYRSTRIEQYGPRYRSSESAQDLMKTIDLRERESLDSICALVCDMSALLLSCSFMDIALQPDIPEEDELEFDNVVFEAAGGGSVHDGAEIPYKREKKTKWLGWLWRLSSTMIRKCCGRQVEVVRNAGRSARFDLSE
ncbi:hypothetical protein L208DRAFT_334264 [Tricholoma matsutake]|nr:hypothetical protein L208DRAFT_334264 [Tricholoma matsutake 945]